ncbi:MAG TPA: STAS/SEC14 domain-containing protein, partial [Sphingomicrobium sp.]|nr:STAS/SEC14 domain-containing protein [Sphingomicrobium sp.]
AVMDRLDSIVAKHAKVNVFIETRGIDGLQISAMPHYMSRALPLFGRLGQFGRVAVVADQAWMRAATRFESAVLPNIRYRVFEPDEREEALAWALGGAPVAG